MPAEYIRRSILEKQQFDEQQRRALTKQCRYCHAPVGYLCNNKGTDEPLTNMPAHLYRLQDTNALEAP